MRSVVIAAFLVLLAACTQAPVKPAPAEAAPTLACPPAPQPPPPAYPPLAAPKQVPQDKDHPLVLMQTNLGNITLQLDAERAPLSVANFLHYVNSHYYDNTSFYRIVPGFVIQAGDYMADYKPNQRKTLPPIPNEAGNGFSNGRGTIAMARTADPHSATSAFYINLVDNHRLDPRGDRWGYAVFGLVVDGLDVVDKIAAMPNGHQSLPNGEVFDNAPQTPVIIFKVTELPLPKP